MKQASLPSFPPSLLLAHGSKVRNLVSWELEGGGGENERLILLSSTSLSTRHLESEGKMTLSRCLGGGEDGKK